MTTLRIYVLIVSLCNCLNVTLPFILSNNERYFLSALLPTNDKKSLTTVCSTAISLEEEVATSSCSDVDDDEEGVLTSLFGSSRAKDSFFQNDLGVRTVHISRIDCELPSPLIRIDIPNLIETNEWTSFRRRGSQDFLNKTLIVNYQEFSSNYIQDGGSMVIPITPDDYLAPFKEKIELSLGGNVSMNIYHSGPSAVALNRHYDTYDVLVLQIEGEKEWEIAATEDEKGEWFNTTMVPGDLLYIPKGIWHAATTASGFDSTTHVTIGLQYR